MQKVKMWAKTKFGAWVRAYTVSRLCDDINARGESCTTAAVYQWLHGSTLPRPRMAEVLVVLAAGAVGLSDIYDHRKQLEAEPS